MVAKRKKVKPRDPNHKALENPLFRQRIVPRKERKAVPKPTEDWGND